MTQSHGIAQNTTKLAENFNPTGSQRGRGATRSLAGTQQQGQIARIGISDKGTGALVKHIRVNPVGTQQRYPALPQSTLGFELREFVVHGRELLFKVLLGTQAMVAGKCIDREIANEQSGKNIKAENGQDRAAAAVSDHGGQNAPCPLKRL
jgi:hypothetical protein